MRTRLYQVNEQRISIEAEIKESCQGSRLYSPDEIAELRRVLPQGIQPVVEVVDGTTQQVAQTLATDGPVALLNFASGRNPGGGFLNGAKAQEEDLCRCSALYPTLVLHSKYYEANRGHDSLLYTDHAIFSPVVPFFKTSGTGKLLSTPFQASVITAPAPNSRPYLMNDGDPDLLEQCFERRWRNILAIARAEKIDTVLLGAWGCGAFGGDPQVASRTAQKALDDFGPAFRKVVFAIPDKGRQSAQNLAVFRQHFQIAS